MKLGAKMHRVICQLRFASRILGKTMPFARIDGLPGSDATKRGLSSLVEVLSSRRDIEIQ